MSRSGDLIKGNEGGRIDYTEDLSHLPGRNGLMDNIYWNNTNNEYPQMITPKTNAYYVKPPSQNQRREVFLLGAITLLAIIILIDGTKYATPF